MKRYNNSPRKPFSTRRLEKKSKQSLVISIVVLLVFIYFFLNWILPTLIGGLSFLNRFKQSAKVDQSIIDSETLAPPVLNIPFEATNTSQITIRGYAQQNSTVEIYIDDEVKKTVNTQDDGSFEAFDVDLSLGINNIFGKTVGEKDSRSLPSKTIRIIFDNKKPKLDIASPSDGQLVKGGDKRVNVSGVTDPGISIRVNNNTLIVDADGKFSNNVDINEGDNTLTITAQDTAGNLTSIERRVRYEQ